jgi:MoaA/NifB/PqqE/SkfB family radical SAM enzyme
LRDTNPLRGAHSLRAASAAAPGEREWLRVEAPAFGADGLALPPDVLARAGLTPEDDLLVDITAAGLRLTADQLRKVYVEVTSVCNLACATCIRNAWDEPLGHMPVERFERLLAGLPRPRTGASPLTLSLSGFGEPLAPPDWLRLVGLAREQGLRVELVTNGLLLDAARASILAALGVAQVAVSLDGGDAASYRGVRGAELAPAAEAARLLVEARRRARTPMAVGAAFVATRRNIDSLSRLLELAHDLQLDFVSISSVVPHTPEMAEEMLWGHAAWAATFKPEGWRPHIVMGHVDANGETRGALGALVESAPVFPPPGLDDGSRRNYCRFVREGVLAASWDGRVAPCLSLLHTHPEYVNGHWKTVRSYNVGHVDEGSLAEIWRDAAYRDFRQRVRAFDFAPCFVCGGCPDTDTNDTDCYANPFPVCGECLWAQGLVLCP